jgi:hypothetical protein
MLNLFESQGKQDDSKRQDLDKFVKDFCNAINDLLKPVLGMPAKTTDSLVDRFGKQTPSHLNFEEFKKLYAFSYSIHLDRIDVVAEEKLRQVFSKLDGKGTGSVSKQEVKSMVDDQDFAW